MRGGARSWALGAWSVLALLYLFVPIFVIVVFSFNDPAGRFNFTWEGFTLDHWANPFENPDLATDVMLHRLEKGTTKTVAFTSDELLVAARNHLELR